ncbi:hypothetical protein SFC15_13655 [Shouchella clausii]
MTRQKGLAWLLIFVSSLVGGFLAIYFLDDGHEYTMLFAIAGGVLLAFIIYLISVRLRKDKKVPTSDERSEFLAERFLAIAFIAVLFISALLLIGLMIMGHTSIQVGTLLIYLMLVFFGLGIGVAVAKRI